MHLWLTAAPRFGIAWPYAASATCSSLKSFLIVAFVIAVNLALVRT
jgi:hypothetical protein